METQDFSRKLIIVVRKDLPGWQAANAIAHIGAYVGNRLGSSFGTGEYFVDQAGVQYPRNSQYAMIIKRAGSSEQLHNLFEKVRATDLLHIAFVREMIDHTNDADLEAQLAKKPTAEVEILGVGVFGASEEVGALTKKFGLWE